MYKDRRGKLRFETISETLDKMVTAQSFINLFYGVGMVTQVNLLVVQNMQVTVYPMHQQTDYSVTVQVSQVQAGIIWR